jgi:hypothetical protein
MRRITSSIILTVLVAFGVLSSASADPLGDVKRAGRVFHAAACPVSAAKGVSHCYARIVTDSAGNILANRAATNAVPAGFGATTLASVYGVYNQGYVLNGGAGVTVAIVDAYGYTNAEKDLGVYRSQYGLPACTTANGCFKKVNQTGGSTLPKQNTGWAQETGLDLDMVSAMCPKCHILLVEANSANFNDLGPAENYAAAHANVVTNSYGAAETSAEGYDQYYNHPNIAITVSSGDSGYGVQFPAASEFVTAVGGTSLSVSGSGTTASYVSETAWSGAGSGCSALYGKPVWQLDTAGCANRTVVDVSAVADPNTAVAAYVPLFGTFSAWVQIGGTSVAAPLMGGVYAVTGVANPSAGACSSQYPSCYPYHAGAANFHDVTSGGNGSCGSYLCTAGPGYDGPTGLGTPKGVGGF